MKTALIFLTAGILLLVLFYWRFGVGIPGQTIDIHIHDTYIVIEKRTVIVATTLFLATLFSIGGLIGTQFRNRFFIILFLICLAGLGYIGWVMFRMFAS